MIDIEFKNLTVDDFIHILKTRKFHTLSEWRDFIRKFFQHYDNTVENRINKDIDSSNRKKEAINRRQYNEDFGKVMDDMDEIVLQRSIIISKVKKDKRYAGRYNYTKRNSRCNKSKKS